MPDRLAEALADTARTTASCLDAVLRGDRGVISEAMRYAMSGGKALRGFLVMEGARLHDVAEDDAKWVATAIECIHAYSLVHDDLPAMDDDDLRRGQPTLHRTWDEATAILAGDALQAMAFHLLCVPRIDDRTKVALVMTLSLNAGVRGMVGGQAMDMAAESAAEPLDLARIEQLQKLKTGALIEWAAGAGPSMAMDADGEMALRRYGRALGLAFQIADDLLDVTASTEELGKRTGKDAGRGKATFVTHLGVDGSRAKANELCDQAISELDSYGDKASLLRDAARFAIQRRS